MFWYLDPLGPPVFQLSFSLVFESGLGGGLTGGYPGRGKGDFAKGHLISRFPDLGLSLAACRRRGSSCESMWSLLSTCPRLLAAWSEQADLVHESAKNPSVQADPYDSRSHWL